jgi:TM2 domain-containing membrane protein YozV
VIISILISILHRARSLSSRVHTISPTNTATNPISVDQPYAGPAASCCSINGTHSMYYLGQFALCCWTIIGIIIWILDFGFWILEHDTKNKCGVGNLYNVTKNNCLLFFSGCESK